MMRERAIGSAADLGRWARKRRIAGRMGFAGASGLGVDAAAGAARGRNGRRITESAATPWLRRSRKKAVLPHAHSKTLARRSVQLDLRMRLRFAGEPLMIEGRRMDTGAIVRRYWHGMPLLICNGLLKERRGMRSYSQLCASRRRRRQNAGMEWNASTESAATPWLRRSRKKAVLPHAHSKTLARGSVQLDLRMRCPGRTVYDRGAADGVSNVADQIGNWVWREGVGDQQGPESRRR